jgi:hypothetical protein
VTRPPASKIAALGTSGDDLLEALASALRAWVGRQAVAEERLTAFAFREGQAAIDLPAPTSLGQLTMQIFAAACDPTTIRFLHAVRGDGRTIESLAPAGMLGLDPADRVALAARVGALAAVGLVGRELESDRVTATPLGEAILALIDDIVRRVSL